MHEVKAINDRITDVRTSRIGGKRGGKGLIPHSLADETLGWLLARCPEHLFTPVRGIDSMTILCVTDGFLKTERNRNVTPGRGRSLVRPASNRELGMSQDSFKSHEYVDSMAAAN